MRNLPKGVWANFTTECVHCRGDIVYRDGRQDRHECREPRPVTLADLQAALDNRNN